MQNSTLITEIHFCEVRQEILSLFVLSYSFEAKVFDGLIGLRDAVMGLLQVLVLLEDDVLIV